MFNNQHYQVIESFYRNKKAQRSGVPLINHINEGVFILDTIGATETAKEAFCIHPILQSDADLSASLKANSVLRNYDLNQASIMLAMEYRAVANAYLSPHCKSATDKIKLSPIKCVNDMLVADKIQNRKDFEAFHLGVHQRSDTLEQYFSNWLNALSISEARYKKIVTLLNEKI